MSIWCACLLRLAIFTRKFIIFRINSWLSFQRLCRLLRGMLTCAQNCQLVFHRNSWMYRHAIDAGYSVGTSDIKRGQMLHIEPKARSQRLKAEARPRPNLWRLGRAYNFGLETNMASILNIFFLDSLSDAKVRDRNLMGPPSGSPNVLRLLTYAW